MKPFPRPLGSFICPSLWPQPLTATAENILVLPSTKLHPPASALGKAVSELLSMLGDFSNFRSLFLPWCAATAKKKSCGVLCLIGGPECFLRYTHCRGQWGGQARRDDVRHESVWLVIVFSQLDRNLKDVLPLFREIPQFLVSVRKHMRCLTMLHFIFY